MRHPTTWIHIGLDIEAVNSTALEAGRAIMGVCRYGLRYGKENLLNDGFLCTSFAVDGAAYRLPGSIDRSGICAASVGAIACSNDLHKNPHVRLVSAELREKVADHLLIAVS